MFNYVKSELYRLTHSQALYAVGFAFVFAPVIVNILLYCLAYVDSDFPYATTSYSYSNVVSSPMIFCYAGLFMVFVFYEGNKKNGNLKNVICTGLSREKLFFGQIVVCLLVSAAMLFFTIVIYIISAQLLLEVVGPVTAMDLVIESLVMIPIAVSSLVLSIVIVNYFDKSSTGIIYWLCIMIFVPKILFYISLVIEPVRGIVMWLPQNFFSGMQVNQTVCAPIWDTTSGLAKCLISGFTGIGIFGIVGLFSLRRKEF